MSPIITTENRNGEVFWKCGKKHAIVYTNTADVNESEVWICECEDKTGFHAARYGGCLFTARQWPNRPIPFQKMIDAAIQWMAT